MDTAALELRKHLNDRHEVVVLDPRDHVLSHGIHAGPDVPSARVMAGPQAHWAKVAFERYFLASRKRGTVAR